MEDVWGIGRRSAKRLHDMGVCTAYDFTKMDDGIVRSRFSITGLRLKRELQGMSVLELEQVSPKQSIRTARSFASPIMEYDQLEERINTFASNCCKRLRRDKLVCQALMVTIRTNGFCDNEPQYSNSLSLKLPFATSSDFTIGEYARMALREISRKGYKYKKAGIVVLDIIPREGLQGNLFVNENPNYNKLMEIVDSVNTHYGKRKLMLVNQNLDRQWTIKQERLSK